MGPGDPLIVAAFRSLFEVASVRMCEVLKGEGHSLEILAKLPAASPVDVSRTLYADDFSLLHKLCPRIPANMAAPDRCQILVRRMAAVNSALDQVLQRVNLKQHRGKLQVIPFFVGACSHLDLQKLFYGVSVNYILL